MVKLELVGIGQPDPEGSCVVILRDETRILPIVIGPSEALAIRLMLMGEKPPRPLTHDLICNLLAGLRGSLKSVTIYKLENNTFFAHLNIEQTSATGQVEQVLRIDSRPSDGIAIALRMNCPIYAAEDVLDAAGQDASLLNSMSGDDDSDPGGDDEREFDA